MNKSGEEPLLSLPERHSRILALLQQNGSISVTQLSELFKVSEVTIRKDLSYLEQQKKLYRTHGSAILISPYISDRHVNEKEKKNVAEKRAIGAAAAALISQDDSIIIASGTTMAFLAREIKKIFKQNLLTKLAAVMVSGGLKRFKKLMDSSEVGGTALVGISKTVIKAHGSSDDFAIKNAIRQAQSFAASGIIEDITENIDHMRLRSE